ncbi:diguanylate cyclase [Pseudomonas sp. PB120]|uniref:sensor domain-containing diguanylate cyclase n=1 Tax=Pseudomonas sp. PB120 TaxID=2494700 RepID=UPI0012FD1FE6|nr:sensor domain-containing diguanylate cyclase [Pseudomonas sp. PB120]MVV49333.1 diguanylate cyclase [Pseudomonas sp. PB120]
MSVKPLIRIDLRRLILLFTLVTALITLVSSLYVVYWVQKQELIEATLEPNRAYATKVASSIDEFLRISQERLAYSAERLTGQLGNDEFLKSEAVRLQGEDSSFNSIAIFDATGKVLEAAPQSLQIKGRTFRDEGIVQVLRDRRPTVSSAFVSEIGNLVIFVSHPLFDGNGQYTGAVGGTIYLQKQSVLYTLISKHFHKGNVQVYVVDSGRRLLYYPDRNRIGQALGPDTAVDAALRGDSGAMESIDSEGASMLAGYAYVSESRWGVICVQSREIALAPLNALMAKVVVVIVPISLIGFVIIWWVTQLITRPLRQLAAVASHLDAGDSPSQIRSVRTWYIEAAHIRRALSIGVALTQEKLGRLNLQAQSDPLTGLPNRRAMDEALQVLQQTRTPFSVLALDIDHFKKVNDTYGHDAGDVALRAIADVLRQSSREGDLPYRIGGEEFTVLLPNTPKTKAIEVAERLRARVEITRIDKVGAVTMSIGVASWLPEGPAVSVLLKQADEHLYKAKEGGRNRVEA